MKNRRVVMLLVLCLLLCGALAWSLFTVSDLRTGSASMIKELAVADSLAKVADDARWYAERQRDKSDGVLEDLKRAYPELERRAKEIETERNVALMNEMEARRQEQGKQVALEGERTARKDEEEQRRIAEARADSLARAKRITDNLNLQQNSSRLAQNSMAVKGRSAFRGLMAVHALRCMDQAGGELNKDELVRALSKAVEELERPDPVRASGFKRPPNQMMTDAARPGILVLGHNGILYHVDGDLKHLRTMSDQSGSMELGTGRSFLTDDGKNIILTDASGNISAYPAQGGLLIASSSGGNPCPNTRFLASWPGLARVVTGNASGNIQVWLKEGQRFRPIADRKAGGSIKGMAFDPGAGAVVVVAAEGPLLLINLDGSFTEIALPQGHPARCIAPSGKGTMVVGTEKGAVLRLNVPDGRITVLHKGGGRRVEVITSSPSTGLVAFVDAVKELVVLNGSGATTRIALDAIPGAMVFGKEDELFVAYGDRVERVLCSSRSMATRICELIGRTWTQEEWNEVGETGTPGPTCSGW